MLASPRLSWLVKRFIFLSSLKVLGEETSRDVPFYHDSIPHPLGCYGRSKLLAENELIKLGRSTGLDVVIIRPPLIHGAGVKGNLDALLRAGIREEAIGEEMNIASAAETEIVEMANTVNELTGNKAGLLYTDRRKWDTKSRLLASVDRARDLLGYDPKTDFATGLRNTISWFEKNWEAIQRDAEFPPGMSSAVKNYVLKQEQQRS